MKRLIVLVSGAAVLSGFLISVITAQQQPGAGVSHRHRQTLDALRTT